MSDDAPSLRPIDRPVTSWLLFAAFVLLYLPTCARVVQGGDSPEFLTIAAKGGVAHPSGYPLFGLLARGLVLALPFGTVAWKVSALSATLGAATLGLLHRATLLVTEDGVAATVAAGALGFSVLFWRWSVVPEVLSGSTLTAALVLLACAHVARGLQGPKAGLFLGLAFATGVAHHHTAILLAPVLVWAWWAAWPTPRTARGALAVTGAGVAGTLVGLLPYLTLMLPGGAWRWGDTETLSGLVHHFLRADYGTFVTGQIDRGIAWWVQPGLYGSGLFRQFAGLPAVLGLAGVAATLSAPKRLRGFGVAVVATWLLAGPLFVTRFDLPAQAYYRVVVERFHSFPNVAFALLIGVGVAWFVRLKVWSRPELPVALLGLNLLVVGALAMPRASMRDATILDDFLRNTLTSVEPGALVISHGDSFNFGCVYASEVLELRPDVACVSPKLLQHDWYRDWVAERHPDLVTRLDGAPMPLPELVIANAEQRPVYLSVRIPEIHPEVVGIIPPTWPAAGTLLRVSGQGYYPPAPETVEAALTRDWERFTIRSRLVAVEELDESLEAPAWDHYALVWWRLAAGYENAGDEEGRQRCLDRARELSPWLVE